MKKLILSLAVLSTISIATNAGTCKTTATPKQGFSSQSENAGNIYAPWISRKETIEVPTPEECLVIAKEELEKPIFDSEAVGKVKYSFKNQEFSISGKIKRAK